MAVTPIRASNAYFGLAKQTVQGTAVAPNIFPRWLDGSDFQYDLKIEDIREGDTTRRLSLLAKNLQYIKAKLLVKPRPNEVGFLETAANGTGSDAFTAPTVATAVVGA